MKTKLSARIVTFLLILISCFAAAGCDSDFYLSESEAAAYAASFSTEVATRDLISSSLPGRSLDIMFNGGSPPSIQSTNLASLLRSYTALGLVEGVNRQVQLDRLSAELQTQLNRWIQKELQVYSGPNNAGVRLSELSSIRVIFLNKPTFTFRPDRQAIAFSANVRLMISGTIDVNALDYVLNLIFGVNGRYPLLVDVNNLTLSGEAGLRSTYSDAGEIALRMTAQPGTITVTGTGGVSVPTSVRDGVRNLLRGQLTRPLKQTFTQRYTYFALAGLGLSQATAQSPSRLQYVYESRPEVARPVLHIVARAADGKLYHLRKTEGGQNVTSTTLPFPSLASRIENEPGLFASDTDQLELAATTTSFELVYAHWRDEFWGYQTTITMSAVPGSTGFTGKPAIVASAPGQVEIIVPDRTGNLWHMRRKNGRWVTPAAVPLSGYNGVSAPFRDPVVAHSGNKIVVVLVDAQNRLLGIAFDMESGVWGQPTSIPTAEGVNYAPTAAASGDGQIDVVYAGFSGTPFHRTLVVTANRFQANTATTGISIVGSEVTIGGRVNAPLYLVASSHKQLGLIGRGTDNKLYYNHFVGPSSTIGFIDGRTVSRGWYGWGDLNGNFSGTLTFENMTGFSAAATRSGRIVTASIPYPWALDTDPAQFVHYNTYNTERFGTQLWKTVHWRGYERAGTQRFLGQPAIVVTDRQSALMYVGNSYTPIGARLGSSNTASFSSFSTSTLPSVPVDASMVSSVAGKYDIAHVGNDGLIRHVRKSFMGGSFPTTFSAVNGQLFRSQPALVGYGNGQLEMVAVAQNNTMYHWRFQNAVWSAPVAIPGTVISQPILVHVGSGQLVLVAVGGDRKLYLWSFTNGAWSGWRQVPTNFSINPMMFGPLAAASWGDGSFDLALVDAANGGLFHGRIGPGYFASGIGLTPSREFASLGGILIDTPILTAISPTRINILAIGTDRVVYSNWSSWEFSLYLSSSAPPMRWSGYDAIGGTSLLMAGVAKLGSNELVTAGIDPGGRMFVSRFNGGAWSQFQPVIGQQQSTLLAPPLFRPFIIGFRN